MKGDNDSFMQIIYSWNFARSLIHSLDLFRSMGMNQFQNMKCQLEAIHAYVNSSREKRSHFVPIKNNLVGSTYSMCMLALRMLYKQMVIHMDWTSHF